MAFQNSGQSGSQPVASTQLAQKFVVDTTILNYNLLVPIILTRGLPRVMVLAQQTAGAAAGLIDVQVSVSNGVGVQGVPEWISVGTATLTPLNVPIVIERNIPTKFLRIQVTKPLANDVTLNVAVMCAQ